MVVKPEELTQYFCLFYLAFFMHGIVCVMAMLFFFSLKRSQLFSLGKNQLESHLLDLTI